MFIALSDSQKTDVLALINALEDENQVVQQKARQALSDLGRPVVLPLLSALVDRFDSASLRQGAHYVFNTLKNHGQLTVPETNVYAALHGLVPEVEAPRVVAAALHGLISP
jgi:HEAT repeat protein